MSFSCYNSSEDKPVKAKDLWEKINALMTDSVSKNLSVPEEVASELDSRHIPHHLLCKSHTIEGFDRSNLSVLSKIEKEVGFRQKLESLNPGVKSFLRGKACIAEAALSSI